VDVYYPYLFSVPVVSMSVWVQTVTLSRRHVFHTDIEVIGCTCNKCCVQVEHVFISAGSRGHTGQDCQTS